MGAARMALTVFLPFAFGFFLSYLYRTVNAVLADDLAAAAGVDAAGLGLLTSAYFVSFAAFQIPLGLLLDRFGPRRVEAALLVVAALGALLFSLADGLGTMTAARMVIGLGVSACLMGAFKNTVMWWPKERLPLINGLILACGGLGALVACQAAGGVPAGVYRLARGAVQGAGGADPGGRALASGSRVPEPRQADRGRTEGLRDQLVGLREVYRSGLFPPVAPMTVWVQGSEMA